MTPAPVVVTNNTPVSNLIRVGQLPLLGRLFGRVLVPQQVADELDRGQHVLAAFRDAAGAGGWLEAGVVPTPAASIHEERVRHRAAAKVFRAEGWAGRSTKGASTIHRPRLRRRGKPGVGARVEPLPGRPGEVCPRAESRWGGRGGGPAGLVFRARVGTARARIGYGWSVDVIEMVLGSSALPMPTAPPRDPRT